MSSTKEKKPDWAVPFAAICQKKHTDQAKWFLNGFWGKCDEEKIWEWTHHFMELQTGKKVLYGAKNYEIEEGCDLDEHQSHRFLERIGEVLTVKELRAKLKKLDIDSNNRLCLTEYLVNKYGKTGKALVEAPQGGVDPDLLDAAQAQCDDAKASLDTASVTAQAAKQNNLEAKKTAQIAADKLEKSNIAAKEASVALEKANKEAEEAGTAKSFSDRKAEEAKTATKNQEEVEQNLKNIEAEVKSAVQSLEAAELAQNLKIKKLEDKLKDKNLSTVKKGSFVYQLAQLKEEDPMPLRKARITQTAALKKQKKATKAAKKVTEKCVQAQEAAEKASSDAEQAKKEADDAAAASAKAKTQADNAESEAAEAKNNADHAQQLAEESEAKAKDAVEEADKKFKAANENLNKLKNSDEPPNGAIWWMQRTLKEQEKYMPRRKKKK